MSLAVSSPYQRQLVDAALLAYVEWREECRGVWDADGRWANATPEDRVRAHAAYEAALQREEAAASAYADLIERVASLVETGWHFNSFLEGPIDLAT